MNEIERELKHINSRLKRIIKKGQDNQKEIQRLELRRIELEEELETSSEEDE
jgi:hypothetical protein